MLMPKYPNQPRTKFPSLFSRMVMEIPQLRPVSSLTRCLKFASALSLQRIFLPRGVNPRKRQSLIGATLLLAGLT